MTLDFHVIDISKGINDLLMLIRNYNSVYDNINSIDRLAKIYK